MYEGALLTTGFWLGCLACFGLSVLARSIQRVYSIDCPPAELSVSRADLEARANGTD